MTTAFALKLPRVFTQASSWQILRLIDNHCAIVQGMGDTGNRWAEHGMMQRLRCWGGGGWQVDGRKVCITPGWHHTDTGTGLSCTLSASRTLPASRHHHQASPSSHHRTRCCPSAAAAYQFTASRLSSIFTNLDWFLVFNKKQSKNNLGCVKGPSTFCFHNNDVCISIVILSVQYYALVKLLGVRPIVLFLRKLLLSIAVLPDYWFVVEVIRNVQVRLHKDTEHRWGVYR